MIAHCEIKGNQQIRDVMVVDLNGPTPLTWLKSSGAGSPVCVSLSRDGKLIVTGHEKGTLSLWEGRNSKSSGGLNWVKGCYNWPSPGLEDGGAVVSGHSAIRPQWQDLDHSPPACVRCHQPAGQAYPALDHGHTTDS